MSIQAEDVGLCVDCGPTQYNEAAAALSRCRQRTLPHKFTAAAAHTEIHSQAPHFITARELYANRYLLPIICRATQVRAGIGGDGNPRDGALISTGFV